jgi:DNA-binding beta-propeller fold protein YncE
LVTVGQGDHTYRVVKPWARLPDDWELGEVGGVAVDALDRVYVFARGPHPMTVFDPDGNLLTSWGEDIFDHPHAVHIGADGMVYCTDDGDHTVRKLTPDGQLLLELGTASKPSPPMSGIPFNRCTHTALSPDGEIYVSDGYRNARVHKYSPDGELMASWGRPGVEPGEFNLPHNLACDADGWIYVADRENHRVQVLDASGAVHDVWHSLHRPSALFMPAGRRQLCYVGEIGPYLGSNRGTPNLGPRITILANDGAVLVRLGVEPTAGTEPGKFVSPHGIAVDSRGDIYVGEVVYTAWPKLFPERPMPRSLCAVHKLVKVQPDDAG